jgi:hypothetical protein
MDGLLEAFDQSADADVALVVKDSSHHHQAPVALFFAHRLVLRRRSGYFQQHFQQTGRFAKSAGASVVGEDLAPAGGDGEQWGLGREIPSNCITLDFPLPPPTGDMDALPVHLDLAVLRCLLRLFYTSQKPLPPAKNQAQRDEAVDSSARSLGSLWTRFVRKDSKTLTSDVELMMKRRLLSLCAFLQADDMYDIVFAFLMSATNNLRGYMTVFAMANRLRGTPPKLPAHAVLQQLAVEYLPPSANLQHLSWQRYFGPNGVFDQPITNRICIAKGTLIPLTREADVKSRFPDPENATEVGEEEKGGGRVPALNEDLFLNGDLEFLSWLIEVNIRTIRRQRNVTERSGQTRLDRMMWLLDRVGETLTDPGIPVKVREKLLIHSLQLHCQIGMEISDEWFATHPISYLPNHVLRQTFDVVKMVAHAWSSVMEGCDPVALCNKLVKSEGAAAGQDVTIGGTPMAPRTLQGQDVTIGGTPMAPRTLQGQSDTKEPPCVCAQCLKVWSELDPSVVPTFPTKREEFYSRWAVAAGSHVLKSVPEKLRGEIVTQMMACLQNPQSTLCVKLAKPTISRRLIAIFSGWTPACVEKSCRLLLGGHVVELCLRRKTKTNTAAHPPPTQTPTQTPTRLMELLEAVKDTKEDSPPPPQQRADENSSASDTDDREMFLLEAANKKPVPIKPSVSLSSQTSFGPRTRGLSAWVDHVRNNILSPLPGAAATAYAAAPKDPVVFELRMFVTDSSTLGALTIDGFHRQFDHTLSTSDESSRKYMVSRALYSAYSYHTEFFFEVDRKLVHVIGPSSQQPVVAAVTGDCTTIAISASQLSDDFTLQIPVILYAAYYAPFQTRHAVHPPFSPGAAVCNSPSPKKPKKPIKVTQGRKRMSPSSSIFD